jgi:hypothetical protein
MDSREIPFDKLRAGSRPAGENAGLLDDAFEITAETDQIAALYSGLPF